MKSKNKNSDKVINKLLTKYKKKTFDSLYEHLADCAEQLAYLLEVMDFTSKENRPSKFKGFYEQLKKRRKESVLELAFCDDQLDEQQIKFEEKRELKEFKRLKKKFEHLGK